MPQLPTQTALRLSATPDLRTGLESVVCDKCQGLCWHIEVWSHDIGGSGEKVCLTLRDHIVERSEAMLVLGRWLMKYGGQVRRIEYEAWVIEHQQTIPGI